MRSYLSKPYVIWLISISFYWISLYPGRFGADINSLITLIEVEKTTAHWTALYFRFFQIVTLNGNFIGFGSLICMVLLALSLENFIRSIAKTKNSLNLCRAILALSPFYGVFGMTFDHQLPTTVGFLNCLSFLLQKKSIFSQGINNSWRLCDYLWLIWSILLMQTTFQGTFISCIFIMLVLPKRYSVLTLLGILSFAIYSPTLLQVSTSPTPVSSSTADLRMVPLLGDIKCVVQHPKVILNDFEKMTLLKLGSMQEWREPKSCIVADNAFFALRGSSKFEVEIATTWISLFKRYPQIVLVAHIQRSSMALPPPFFRGQPNMIPTNDLDPAGIELSVEMHQWSELFKTSLDNINLSLERPKISRLLEPLPLLPAFFFNQNSGFWGWGGLWLAITFTVLLLRLREGSSKTELMIMIPLFSLSVFLFILSPSSACRYVMPQILTGLLLTLEYFLRLMRGLLQSKV